MRYRAYTGVGSRKTPEDVQQRMHDMAVRLALHEITLRSGGAKGADLAFENGCNLADGPKEIYRAGDATPEAHEIAADIHPAWHHCNEHARALHARNVHQVLGQDLETPSLFVICWTPGGNLVGGTRTAIILARRNKIPTFNLGGSPWPFKEILKSVVVKQRFRKREAKT